MSVGYISAQEYVYVNTRNLIMRDRPKKLYNVYLVMQPPCPLLVERYDDDYKDNKEVKDKFYRVSISYNDSDGIHHYVSGWVLKKYVVHNLYQVTVPGLDTRSQVPPSPMLLSEYVGPNKYDRDFGNAAKYQPPVYKGGEKQPPPFKRQYRTGLRGGCYYVNQKGHRIYVDKHFCNK